MAGITADHPRPCGEKFREGVGQTQSEGSPPPMRGKVAFTLPIRCDARITPAHAGKSLKKSCTRARWEDHPRPCGEKIPDKRLDSVTPGSPPPMRGKGQCGALESSYVRITPAHAGKRLSRASCTYMRQDHPRPCGEKREGRHPLGVGLGSPPPMRGKGAINGWEDTTIGITPAHAGKSVLLASW